MHEALIKGIEIFFKRLHTRDLMITKRADQEASKVDFSTTLKKYYIREYKQTYSQ